MVETEYVVEDTIEGYLGPVHKVKNYTLLRLEERS